MRRAIDGYAAWAADSRPLASLIFFILSGGRHIADSFPVPQILGAIALSATEIAFSRQYLPGAPWLGTVCALFISGNPFLLQNLSYHFDSVFMCLSVGLAAAPFLTGAFGISLAGGAVAVAASLLTYQASISIFFMLCAAEIVFGLMSSDSAQNIIQRLVVRVGQIAFGALAFLLIKHAIASPDEYAAAHSALNFSGNWALVTASNFDRFLDVISQGTGGGLFWAMKFTGIVLGLSAMVAIITSGTGTARVIGAILLLLAIPALAIAPLCVLKSPVFMVRVLLSLGFIPALYGAFIFRGGVKLSGRIVVILGAISLFYTIQITAIYAAAARSQALYENDIANNLADDIFSVSQDHPIKNYYFVSFIPIDKAAQSAEIALPLVGQLVFPYFESWSDNPFLVMDHHDVTLPSGSGPKDPGIICKFDLLKRNRYYDLRYTSGTLVVDFGKTGACP